MRADPAPIRILPDHVANQIAAGEVVERPSSVVKELVENALDAGASRISVRLRDGGKAKIEVSDNGIGMSKADALLALDRHATSKIRIAEDLRGVRSFGFRGEALPSIAAVSRFELHTATRPEEGVRVRVDFGRIRSATDRPRKRGTTVGVRSLFHDLPARAKFLGPAAAEARRASEALVLLALSNPEVGFRLESGRRVLLDAPPAGGVLDRIRRIWGDLADTLIPIGGGEAGGPVSGFVQRPDSARAGGSRRYTFVNGRPFRDPGLLAVVDDAFRTTVVPGIRPSVFLRLEAVPGDVDVNVHPGKAEVRFRDRAGIEEAVRSAVREALRGLQSVQTIGAPKREVTAFGSPKPGGTRRAKTIFDPMPQYKLFDVARIPLAAVSEGRAKEPDTSRSFSGPELWQLHDRYILTATQEGLIIIDQHSAHERVLYEEIMARFEEGDTSAQALLFPVTMRFSPSEAVAVNEIEGLLRRIGFELEPFGECTFVLQAAPHPHPRFDAEQCLREMVRELTEGSPLVDSARNQHERIAMSMACKGAVKAGEPLSKDEARELFDRLFATKLPGHDVHGRPTILRLSTEELDRRFGRH